MSSCLAIDLISPPPCLINSVGPLGSFLERPAGKVALGCLISGKIWHGYRTRPDGLLSETTGLYPTTLAIRLAILLAADFSGSLARCAYRAVVCTWL